MPQKSPAIRPEPVHSPEFLARQKRIDDALHLRKPDRVPVAPLVVHYYPTRAEGVSNRDAMYDPARTLRIWKEATIRHNWDLAVAPGSLLPVRPLEIMGMKQVEWPGGALGDNQPFQWVEGEYMRQDEYDEMLADPDGFAVRKLWPRISRALAPLEPLLQAPPPPLLFLSNAYQLPGLFASLLSAPPAMELLEKLLALVKAQREYDQIAEAHVAEMTAAGFPMPFRTVTFTAFDWISDVLRGMKGSMLDMYQAPDRLLATIAMSTPWTIQGAIMMAKLSGNTGVFIPMHRGAGGFMSNKQFEKFYWPCFRDLVLGLIDAGLTPIPLFEGDYTPRLEFLAELPPRRILAHFDRVDRHKARKLLGDRMCFWGNVPSSLMVSGTVQQVKDDVKELIDLFGDSGGLIIDSTVGIPDEAKPGNAQALTDAVFEYGVN